MNPVFQSGIAQDALGEVIPLDVDIDMQVLGVGGAPAVLGTVAVQDSLSFQCADSLDVGLPVVRKEEEFHLFVSGDDLAQLLAAQFAVESVPSAGIRQVHVHFLLACQDDALQILDAVHIGLDVAVAGLEKVAEREARGVCMVFFG